MNSQVWRSPVAIVGPGRLGGALARALFHRGASIRAIVGPDEQKAERLAHSVACESVLPSARETPSDARAVLLCTPDDSIPEIASELAHSAFAHEGVFVAHFSGALPAAVLWPLEAKGALIASIHPVQSLAGRDDDWQRLEGIYYGIDAEGRALSCAEELVSLLGGVPVRIPGAAKAPYHLACSLASNFTVALLDWAAATLSEAGLSREQAVRVLLPLAEGTIQNVRQLGVVGAITGPLARGDVRTVTLPLEVLRRQNPELEGVYKTLGKMVVALGRRRGSFDETKLAEIASLLDCEVEQLEKMEDP